MRSSLPVPRRRILRAVLPVFLCVLVASSAGAQRATATDERGDVNPAAVTRTAATAAMAVRADAVPELDGRDDEAVWRQAPVIDGFLEYEPNEGAETRFRTEARVSYDNRNLYVFVRMYDPAPDSIVSLLARRDERVPSEQLKLVIDSYHDRRTAYQFAVNPAGVKRDFYVYNDNVEDPSWDAVWDVATAIDSTGWTAEFSIPLSQLRYADKPEHTFGLMIVRDVARTGARISWPLYRRNIQGYVSQSGEIGGIVGIPAPRRLEVAPYVVTQNVTRPSGDGFDHPQRITAGADLKYGLSSNLTLDATINPDFGQVEADPAQLNLSSFEQFYEERRPFFLEGTGIFSYRVQCDDIDTGCTGLFYSRRIGRAPQLAGRFGDERSATASTILGAAKMTGRLGGGLSVGLLDAVTAEEQGTLGRAIEPRTNYLVARARQDLRGGSSDVGAMFTAVNRALDPTATPYLRGEAYTGGLDLRHRFWSNNYELSATLTGSAVRGSAEAITAVQQDGVHNYQRPDDGVSVDPSRTSLFGDAERVSLSKFGGGRIRFQSVYQRYSPGFEINDLGFLARADDQLLRNWMQYSINQPTRFSRQAFFNFNHWSNWTSGGLPTQLGGNINWHVQLPTMWWVHLGSSFWGLGETYDDRAARGGPALRNSRGGNVWSGFETDNRKAISGSLFAGTGRGDEGRSRDWYVNPSLNFRLASSFSGSLGFNYSWERDDSQWRANFGDAGADTTHYTFARLEQTTASLTTRINYTFTPALSLQIYAEPFVTTGIYSDWRELADPRAADYAARFRPFTGQGDPGGFRFMQFRSNSVLRWEYRPGSTLFLVWAQGRQDFNPNAHDFDFSRDREALFSLHPDNTLLLKLSYWLNP